MSFEMLKIKPFYISPEDEVIDEFFIPVLSESVRYDRAVAFFSSQALYEMTVGIGNLIKNNGKIRYIISPVNLSEEDINAINKGYEERQKFLDKLFSTILENDTDYFVEERLNLLAHLIEDSYLDIKIAIPKNVRQGGLFHDKYGIFEDMVGDEIAFCGSFNDTPNAIYANNERISTYSTIKGQYEEIDQFNTQFEKLWNNKYEFDEVIDFPDNLKSTLHKYMKPDVNYDIDNEEALFIEKMNNRKPKKPEYVQMRDYQIEAVNNWCKNGYCGIFDMATGSGKTFTALYGICDLLQKEKVYTIICCPYQHLVDQWCEDLEKWNFNYIIGYTGSPMKQWKKRLKDTIGDFNRDVIEYGCLIVTNASFKTSSVQNEIKRIKGKILLVVDEAHNFGADNLRKLLFETYDYRMALSATIDRYNDETGTKALHDFFGCKCIEYSLKDAIDNDQLTRYFYYPIIVHLTENELEQYNDITDKIRKETRYDEVKKSLTITQKGKHLLIKRARIIAGAENKLVALKQLMINERESNHILVYCGATTVNDPEYHEDKADEYEIRQIDVVTKILGNELGMLVSRFTSEETAEQRRELVEVFDNGISCQALIAIKCLDEGVSIKSIEKAYILASSTNPREYVQRRGRVLRKYPGKNFAYIYDFVTLPRDLNEVRNIYEDISGDYSLIRRELVRVKDFAELAENSSESDKIINRIEEIYGVIDNSAMEMKYE